MEVYVGGGVVVVEDEVVTKMVAGVVPG